MRNCVAIVFILFILFFWNDKIINSYGQNNLKIYIEIAPVVAERKEQEIVKMLCLQKKASTIPTES